MLPQLSSSDNCSVYKLDFHIFMKFLGTIYITLLELLIFSAFLQA